MASIFTEKPDPLALRLRLQGFWPRVLVWLPAAFAVAVICNESQARFSADNTSHFLRPLVERIFGPIGDGYWEEGHHLFRKTGHFTGYGLLCLTFVRAWLYELGCVPALGRVAWRWRSVLLGVLCCFLVASGDEFHQTFVPGRTGLFSDVLLDTAGGCVACAVTALLFWRQPTGR